MTTPVPLRMFDLKFSGGMGRELAAVLVRGREAWVSEVLLRAPGTEMVATSFTLRFELRPKREKPATSGPLEMGGAIVF